MISTKGRYALRVMIDLAEHPSEGFIPLKAIAERQNISTNRGKIKGGGYRCLFRSSIFWSV